MTRNCHVMIRKPETNLRCGIFGTGSKTIDTFHIWCQNHYQLVVIGWAGRRQWCVGVVDHQRLPEPASRCLWSPQVVVTVTVTEARR